MPVIPAEKQRRYRERLKKDPGKYEQVKIKDKKNFYLFSNLLYEFGFQRGTWSFFEASHGKGVADGIGATIKRTADRLVSHRKDISNATELYEKLHGETTIKLFFINETDIVKIEKILPKNIATFHGTFEVHQIITVEKGTFLFRNVSCFCERSGICDCFQLKEFSFCKGKIEQKKVLKKAKILGRGKIYSSSSNSDDEMSLYSDSDLNDTILSEAAEMMDQDMILEEASTHKIHPGAFVLVEFGGGT